MSKGLILAEKPSVANDIAKALGGFEKKGNYFERDDLLVSCARGHLVEIVLPKDLDVGYDLWRLPMLPPQFGLAPATDKKTHKVDEDAVSRLKGIRELMDRADVDRVINACDAGREGELIFMYIYHYNKCKKPFSRMWLQSMTPDSIKKAYNEQRTGASMKNLFLAAQSRSEADWLVGVNGTRGLCAAHEVRFGERELFTAGRVQSPLLAIIVDREDHIKSFVPRDYWEVTATFGGQNGTYKGKWWNPNFDKAAAKDGDAAAERFLAKSEAEEIAGKCSGQIASDVSEESKETSEAPPKLFDLTSLQREANVRFGFSAEHTLECAQKLYDVHKATTYPRTDAKALPEDYVETAKQILASFDGSSYAVAARKPLDGGWVKPGKPNFDNSKISDHFAIIPTTVRPSGMDSDMASVYDLIVRRFVAAFYPAARFLKTTRLTTVSGEVFKTDGSVLLDPGWKAVYGKDANDQDSNLCKIEVGELPPVTDIQVDGKRTKPKPRFTEATLLTAMEHAGRELDDEALADAMAERGLGTPATRAPTIAGLFASKRGYAERQGKEIVPTEKGIKFIHDLRKMGIAALTSPVMTGELEYKLGEMEKGRYDRKVFMAEVGEATKAILDKVRASVGAGEGGEQAMQAPPALSVACPKCGNHEVRGRTFSYECACGFKVSKEIAGRKLTLGEVEQLLRDRETPVLQGFISSKKKPFAAKLKLDPDLSGKVGFDFDDSKAATGAASGTGAAREEVGDCPICKSKVVVNGAAYSCTAVNKPDCKFQIWGTRLEKTISKAQVVKLLKTGRSDLINGFVSKGSGKTFSAYLTLNTGGEVGFAFEK